MIFFPSWSSKDLRPVKIVLSEIEKTDDRQKGKFLLKKSIIEKEEINEKQAIKTYSS